MFVGEANSNLITILGVIFAINAVLLVVFVLFRQGDSGGIGAAFGGGDGGGALGTKGQAFVDKVIAFMGFAFITLALVYSLVSTGGRSDDTRGVGGSQAESSDSGAED